MVAPVVVAKAAAIGAKVVQGVKTAAAAAKTAEGVKAAVNVAQCASAAAQTVDSAVHIKDSIFGKKQPQPNQQTQGNYYA